MKARGRLMVLLCAAAALLALPAGAGAKPGYVVKQKSLSLQFDAPASNGYELEVRTVGHRQVTVSVDKGSVLALYTATGRVSRKGIEADLGEFGRISLRFHGKSRINRQFIPGVKRPRSLQRRCKGRAPVRERGVFRGNFRFEGENGYTKSVAHRLTGSVVRTYRQICKRRGGASASRAKQREEIVFLRAQAQRFGAFRSLTLMEVSATGRDGESESFTIGFGSTNEKIGRVGVLKVAVVLAEADTMRVSPPSARPVTAEVKMPRPFEGTASFVEQGKAPATWSGTLGIRLPGSGLVPLTGPEFEAEICRARTERGFDRCAETVFVFEALYGSGSHSQPLALARLSSLR